MNKLIDLAGNRFGRLVVVRRAPDRHYVGTFWLCRCDCGVLTEVPRSRLVSGATKSCGCLARELSSQRSRIDGRSKKPIHTTWRTMVARCTNEKHDQFAHYGARGIRVCERWRDFANFLADMGERPSPRHSLDRIDPNGNYEPGNVRWATREEQQRNRRNNHHLTIDGVTRCISEWSEISGIDWHTIHARLRRNWSEKDAVFVPVKRSYYYLRSRMARVEATS